MLAISDLNVELFKICRELADAHAALDAMLPEWAAKENQYRKKKAYIYLNADGTIDARKAKVDAACEDERLAAHLAEARKEAMIERIRSLRAQLSAIETMIGSLQLTAAPPAPPELPAGKWSDDVPF